MNRLSPGLKLAYASGTITFAVKDVAFAYFVLFYYYQVLGVSGKLAGLALLFALISDSITDPIMGSFSDQFRSRWGRRHPFMVIGTLPLALCFLALFNPPDGLSEFQLFIWLTVVAILLRTSLTVFFIPYLALGAEISTDYQERTSVTTYRTTVGWIVGVLFYWAVLKFIFRTVDGVDGRLVENNYWSFAICSFLLIVIFAAISIFFTRKRIPFLPKSSTSDQGFGLSKVIVDLWDALRNRNFRVMFFVIVTSAILGGIGPAVNMHMGTFFFELTINQMAYIGLLMITANLFVFMVMDQVGKRIDKHHLLQFSFICIGLNLFLFIGSRLVGILPENGTWALLVCFFLWSFINTMCVMITHIIPPSMIADIADEHEYETGVRMEGVFFAAMGFSGKAVSGFGTFLGGLILDFVGMPTNVNPGEVPPKVLFNLGLMVGPVVGILFIIPFIASTRFKISRSRHAEIKKALQKTQDEEVDAIAT